MPLEQGLHTPGGLVEAAEAGRSGSNSPRRSSKRASGRVAKRSRYSASSIGSKATYCPASTSVRNRARPRQLIDPVQLTRRISQAASYSRGRRRSGYTREEG